MAISLVQSVSSVPAAGTSNVLGTLGSNTTAGNLIIAAFAVRSTGTVTDVTDSQGNTYNRVFQQLYASFYGIDLWYAKNIVGGSAIVTGTISGTSFQIPMMCREYSGLDTTAPFDVSSVGTGSGGTLNSGTTATTSQASELVIGVGGNNSGRVMTAGSGYGNLGSALVGGNWEVYLEDKTVSSVGEQNAIFTMTSGNWACGVATFKEASAAPSPATVGYRSLLGVGL